MRALVMLAVAAFVAFWFPPTRAEAQAALTITPPSGPYGTVFEQRATGLPAGIGVVSVVRDPTGAEHPGPGLGAVPASGEWRVGSSDAWRAERGEPLGEYTVMVKTIDGATTLATATFTVSDAAAQAGTPATLPRAGDMPEQHTSLSVLLGMTLLAGGGLLLRRSLAARTG